MIKNNLCNFICGYNPHNKNSKDFNDHLETNFLLSMNLNQNIYVIGDLNQELLSAQGKLLINLIENNGFNNHIFEATRINTVYLKNKNIFKTSRTLLDVILHNNDTIKQVLVTSCPFSDHKFVCCALGFESIAHKDPIVNMRRLNDANLIEINKLIEISDFSLMHGPDSVDQKWTFLKNSLLELINTVAPIKQIKLKCHDQNSPWFDSEMRSQFKRKLFNI